MMSPVKVLLLNMDGTLRKEITMEQYWYVPPKIVVDGNQYYIRTSPDGIADPLEYTLTNGAYIVP